MSARLAHLAADRPDIAFACKECSRAVGMASRADLTRLKRIGRYLLHTPRAVWEFPLQTEESTVTIDRISDAGAEICTKTRRSTSGGCLGVGQHTWAIWSSIQKVVSLSSAESVYYSIERCASEVIGLANTIRELGDQTHGDKVLLAAAERDEPEAQDLEDPWPADLMTKHPDGKTFGDVV